MAKPTDELPDVSPGKKEKKEATQIVDSQPKSSDNPEPITTDTPPIEAEPSFVEPEPITEAEPISIEDNPASEPESQSIEPARITDVAPIPFEESTPSKPEHSSIEPSFITEEEPIVSEDDASAASESLLVEPEPITEEEASPLGDNAIIEPDPLSIEPALIEEPPISASEEQDPLFSEETEPAETAILTSNGQDPTAISMQIGQGGGAETIDFLDEDNLLQQVAGVFLLWWHWAYFEITVTSPNLPIYNPPKVIHPERVSGANDYEFVYEISDFGYKLGTSKGEEMYSAGMSMCKMFYTIEKMIYILVKRIKDEGISTETEVQVTFDGHLLAQRKAFESIINLSYNVVVTNFDPGLWGERYLDIVKRLSERGYGYPSEAPREIYKIPKRSTSPSKP